MTTKLTTMHLEILAFAMTEGFVCVGAHTGNGRAHYKSLEMLEKRGLLVQEPGNGFRSANFRLAGDSWSLLAATEFDSGYYAAVSFGRLMRLLCK